ncbi:hypothetical protein HanRHA438_Chr07g0307491 [Helianthus annuus]|nr:hypothetical protein HanRHA438_Chr07g0307491 [Helianthus annuus]
MNFTLHVISYVLIIIIFFLSHNYVIFTSRQLFLSWLRHAPLTTLMD